MTEQKIRTELNKMYYKLKQSGNRYYIKGYPNGLSFGSLQEIEDWIKEQKAKKKQDEEEYQKYVEKINDTVTFPTYSESCKEVFFGYIRECGIKDSRNSLRNIFDENSDLYDDMSPYDVENILENINYDKRNGSSLCYDVETEMDGYYFTEIKRLNPDIDEEVIVDLPDYDPFTFYMEVLEHITVEELKNVVMDIVGTF